MLPKTHKKKILYKIMIISNDTRFFKKINIFLKKSDYTIKNFSNPIDAKEDLKNNSYDLIILDYTLDSIYGNSLLTEIRKINKRITLLLLTNHKKLAPSLTTLKKLGIHYYCEKSNTSQLTLLIESALKSITQMQIINEMNQKLIDVNYELKKAYLDTIGILRKTVEAKDPYTRGHSDRVSEYAVLLGHKFNLKPKTIHTLKIGSLFHDIGKIGIPDSILLKKSSLTDNEYSKIKEHPLIGASILGNAQIFKDILPIVLYHHERYDGKGYPTGLAGEEIPLLVRITTVADAFDSMISKRSYRDALDLDKIKAELINCSGSQFDPKCAEAFLNILENDYNKIKRIQRKY